MRFVNIATAFAIATVAQAFVIPSHTANGVYAVTIGADGKEVHTKISDSASIQSIQPGGVTPVNKPGDLERREAGRIWCGCGFNMDPGNCDAAVESLVAQMGSIVNPGMSYYSIHDNVVAFACNRSPNRGWFLIGNQYRDALARITASCGRYIAGATQSGDDGQDLISGYARWREGDDFCRGSTSSPVNRC
ncbi:hypothetical protein MAJ_08929, partial [Metarhizium majus ARSEF 297]